MEKKYKEQLNSQEIKNLAYKFYLERGKLDGYDQEDWEEAKKTIRWYWLDKVICFGSFVIFLIGLQFFGDKGRTLEYLFLSAIFGVIFITSYSAFRKNTDEKVFGILRAVFRTLLLLVPVMVFISSNWPAPMISGVKNVNYQLIKLNDGSVIMPEKAVLKIKNYSNTLVRDLNIRYWFISGQEKDIEERCSLSSSISPENFVFGPQEEKPFEIGFGNLANKSNGDQSLHVHHLFLLVQMKYRPLFFWPMYEKTWGVMYYAPATAEWVFQRKNHSYWKPYFRQWIQWLDRGQFVFPSCPDVVQQKFLHLFPIKKSNELTTNGASTMNNKELFALFYGVFFASMLSSCWGLRLFQWGWILRKPWHRLRRLIVALLLLNILPALMFSLIYLNLPNDYESNTLPFIANLFIFTLGLSVFGFYRIYHYLISFERIKNLLYDKEDLDRKDLRDRFTSMGFPFGQFISICFYFSPVVILFVLMLIYHS